MQLEALKKLDHHDCVGVISNHLQELQFDQMILYARDCICLSKDRWRSTPFIRDSIEYILFSLEKHVFESRLTSEQVNVLIQEFLDGMDDLDPLLLGETEADRDFQYEAAYASIVCLKFISNSSLPFELAGVVCDADYLDKIVDLYNQAYDDRKFFFPHYKNSDTLGIAHEIVKTKNFSLMPILADAIMDAGCPEKSVHKIRNGTGLSNWALYNLMKI